MDAYAVAGGHKISLSDGDICYLMGWDGLGAMPLRRLMDSGPQQHGSTDRGFKCLERHFQLVLDLLGTSAPDLEVRRRRLRNALRPSNSAPLSLLFELDSGAERQIDCAYDGESLRMGTQDRLAFYQRMVAGFIAGTPVLYDPTPIEYVWTLAVLEKIRFPIEFDLEFGGDLISETVSIPYGGSRYAYPIITITGPLNNTQIHNLTTSELLDFSTYDVAAGEVVTIDCRYAHKSVRNQDNDNLLSYITQNSDSDLATFHLQAAEPPLDLPVKVNEIYVMGSGAVAGQTRVALTYYTAYDGI